MRRGHYITETPPGGYSPLEYLESVNPMFVDGQYRGQYIVVDTLTTQDMEIGEEFMKNDLTKTGIIMGSQSSSSTRFHIGVWPASMWHFGHGSEYTQSPQVASGRHTAVLDGVTKSAIVDGTTIHTFTSGSFSGQKIALFGTYVNASYIGSLNECRIYGAWIKKSGVLVHRLTPVLRNSDNKPGMYDTENDVFYTNGGRGEFLYA